MHTTRLIIMIVLTSVYFLIELIFGYVTNSTALIADSFHMLSDVLALLVALAAIIIAKRKSSRNTFGWIRAEIMGALINSVFLMALCFTIFLSAIDRMVNKESIEKIEYLLAVGVVGLVVNLIGMVLFNQHGHHHHHGHGAAETRPTTTITEEVAIPSSPSKMARYPERALNDIIVQLQQLEETQNETEQTQTNEQPKQKTHSLNIKGVFLHVLADALGSVVVIISGLIIKFAPKNDDLSIREWVKYVDPVLSIILAILIIASTWPLFRESARILLQNVPSHLDTNHLKKQLLVSVPEIKEIHDFHVWQLNNDKIIGSAHVKRTNLSNYMDVADNMKKFFHENGIHSTTIQIEHDEKENNGNDCLLSCPTDDGCIKQTCCGR